MNNKKICLLSILAFLICFSSSSIYAQTSPLTYQAIPGTKPRNVIFILSDDHRYDFMGFTGKVPGLQTPNLDRLANEGVHFQNAFVTTALCSPSRASILTGQFAHTHTVVDNETAAPKGLVFFPQYLQKAGYQTGFFGKWHMGGGLGEPRPGFNRWVSFNGQGTYYSVRLNIDGKAVAYPDTAYISDILTDLSLDWLKKRDKTKPFFMYLSHKAVHSEFAAAKRDKGAYKDIQIQYPISMFTTATPTSKKYTKGKLADGSMYTFNDKDIPRWVREQRYSWHGVDYMYHGRTDFDEFYVDYLETLLSIDFSVGRVLNYLKENNLDKETLVIYMGDNGFAFGEHGLIDKRQAYEESMRVPLLARCPALIKPGTKIKQMVLNVDIGPSILEMAGVKTPKQMQGQSFLPLLKGEQVTWRDKFFYEYYWESNFPQTPTQFAIRTDQYKFIRNYGVWDIDQLYDIQNDPYEVNNLIRNPQMQATAQKLNEDLFKWLEQTGGLQIPLKPVLDKKKDNLYLGTW